MYDIYIYANVHVHVRTYQHLLLWLHKSWYADMETFENHLHFPKLVSKCDIPKKNYNFPLFFIS